MEIGGLMEGLMKRRDYEASWRRGSTVAFLARILSG